MNRSHSLRGREAFRRLYSQGRTWSQEGLRVRYLAEPGQLATFAFSAPRAAGNAVARNRARRVMREAVRQVVNEWPGGMFHFRLVATRPYSDLSAATKVIHEFRNMLRS